MKLFINNKFKKIVKSIQRKAILFNTIKNIEKEKLQRRTNLKEIETAVNQYGKILVSKNNIVVISMEE